MYLALASWRWCCATARCLGTCVTSPLDFFPIGINYQQFAMPAAPNEFYSALARSLKATWFPFSCFNTWVLDCVKQRNRYGKNEMYAFPLITANSKNDNMKKLICGAAWKHARWVNWIGVRHFHHWNSAFQSFFDLCICFHWNYQHGLRYECEKYNFVPQSDMSSG